MADKIGDKGRLVSTPHVAQPSRPRKTMQPAITQRPSLLVRREIWKRQQKYRNCPSERAYVPSCVEFDIDPAISTALGIFHHLECLESRRYHAGAWRKKENSAIAIKIQASKDRDP